jgi:hypothetical protein
VYVPEGSSAARSTEVHGTTKPTQDEQRNAAALRDHQARVKVSDDVWTDFREATRNSSVAIALGELVTREVDRYRARRVRDGSADERELLEALERAQELHADLPSS